jgi:hypothetical protein
MKLPSEFANEIARLMRDPDARRGGHGHYDPNQPRVPAGNPKGGEWTDKGGGGGAQTVRSSKEIENEIARLMRDPDALRHERESMPMFGRRVPTEQPDDGRRTDTGVSAAPVRGNRDHPLVQQVRFDFLRRPIQKGIEAVLALFAAASALNRPDQQAVVEFRARGFEPHAAERGVLDDGKIAILNRTDVEQACPRFGEVQRLTNQAEQYAKSSGGIMSPSQFGTKVHTRLKELIDRQNDPNFRAEVSYDGTQKDARYGQKLSIRVDVLERLGNGVVCVYDIKTGDRALEGPRMTTIARKVLQRFPDTRRIIVTEVRPNR